AEANKPNAERAFFVADLGQVYKQYVRWKRCLPGIEPFYAVKCNPDPYVLRLLGALGTGFDCASHGEINLVTEIGVDTSRIIYANPCKSLSFIRHAARAAVDMMTFDNTDELLKISSVFPTAKLVVRILTDDSKSLCRLGLKFGAPLATVPALLEVARELGLDVIGVSFHVGSGCYDSNAFADAVKRARTAFDMGAEAGYRFTLLDVGGGFESFNFETTAGVLSRALETHFPFAKRDGVRVIAEPGRYFVSSAFVLATNIIARRVNPAQPQVELMADEANQPKVMYYINDGVYGSFNCIMFDHQKVTPYPLTIDRSVLPIIHLQGPGHLNDKDDLVLSSVWGPTCDSIDCVAPLAMLPGRLASAIGLVLTTWVPTLVVLRVDSMGLTCRRSITRVGWAGKAPLFVRRLRSTTMMTMALMRIMRVMIMTHPFR
ncbi:pyridoxal-dependent decarboxylase, partial [Cantharellus anzutake]|uniref:pyridoxal-dependent decarboxylase n=1 Tax=Cantharellus anzutake TaxID=1750568 RepID=UPI0019073399